MRQGGNKDILIFYHSAVIVANSTNDRRQWWTSNEKIRDEKTIDIDRRCSEPRSLRHSSRPSDRNMLPIPVMSFYGMIAENVLDATPGTPYRVVASEDAPNIVLFHGRRRRL